MIDFPIFDQDALWLVMNERFYDVAATVGDCVSIALRDTPGTGGQPKRACYPNFGLLAWDACDCGGSIQIGMGRRTVTTNFPQEVSETGGNRPTACGGGSPMQDFTLEYTTCWPQPNAQGAPPTCQQMWTATAELDKAIFAIRKAMYDCLCDIKGRRLISDYIIRASQPAGPEGGCAGWSTTFSVEVMTLG